MLRAPVGAASGRTSATINHASAARSIRQRPPSTTATRARTQRAQLVTPATTLHGGVGIVSMAPSGASSGAKCPGPAGRPRPPIARALRACRPHCEARLRPRPILDDTWRCVRHSSPSITTIAIRPRRTDRDFELAVAARGDAPRAYVSSGAVARAAGCPRGNAQRGSFPMRWQTERREHRDDVEA